MPKRRDVIVMTLSEPNPEGLGALRLGHEADEAFALFLRMSWSSLDRVSNGSIWSTAVFLSLSIFQAPRTKPSMRNVALTLAAERIDLLAVLSGDDPSLSAWERMRLS